ncbi:MAG: ribose-phosphate diphosphokinase [Thermoplasmata archaeon]|nr:MAG: ribose-phosphate diphosphokinase [Thermoplasmata archaeon]
MKILPGTTNMLLSERLSQCLDAPLLHREIKRFPDGEAYVRLLEDVSGEDVVTVQSTYPDERIVELFLMVDALREAGAERIRLVIPYFGYARQDRVFQEGEALSARALARRIEVDVDEIYTVNLHKEYITKYFSRAEVHHLSVMPELGLYLAERGAEIIFSPDKGALPYAREAAEAANLPYDHLNKRRIDSETVVIEPAEAVVVGKVVGIVDDIIATGGTIRTAREQLLRQGAEEIYVVAVHGLFTGGAIEKFRSAGVDVAVTDTIQTPLSRISAAGAICRALKERG